MTERTALILYAIGVLLVEVLAFGALVFIGASSNTMLLAYVVLLCAAGLGVGEIVSRYHR